MELVAVGTVAGKGAARVTVSARPHAERLTFHATASLDGFDPAQMNAYLSATKGVTLKPGVFGTRMRFRCEAGRLRGVDDPQLRDSGLQGSGDLGSALKALFGKVAMSVTGPTEGTAPSGTIAVTDDLTDPHVPYDTVVDALLEGGYEGSLSSEYEGARDLYLASDMVRRQQAMLRSLIAVRA